MSKKREPTFSSSPVYEPSDDLQQIDLEAWSAVVLKGLAFGVGFYLITLVSLLILNTIGFGGFLVVMPQILIFEAAIFWFLSGFVIWFGPSPSVAKLKSRMFNQSVKPESTSSSLRKGVSRFLIGLVLFLLSPDFSV